MSTSDLRGSDPEIEMVHAVRDGDVAAFEALVKTYYEPLLRFAFGYVKSRVVGEELLQDVFFHLWEQRAQWEVRDTVRGYLFAATRNRALNWLRRVALEQRWADGAAADGNGDLAILPRPQSPDERLALAELDEAIRAAIEQLPPRCRETFILSRLHHLSHEQIGEVMGVSEKTVQAQIGKALHSLRQALAPWRE